MTPAFYDLLVIFFGFGFAFPPDGFPPESEIEVDGQTVDTVPLNSKSEGSSSRPRLCEDNCVDILEYYRSQKCTGVWTLGLTNIGRGFLLTKNSLKVQSHVRPKCYAVMR